MQFLVKFSVVVLWFSVLFSFILGTVVSNFSLLLVLCLLLFFIAFKNYNINLTLIVFTGFVFAFLILVFYFLLGELLGGGYTVSYDSVVALEQVLYYVRGGVIISILFICINVDKELTFGALVCCAVITSFLISQSSMFRFLNIPGSLFDLIPQSLTERQYSGFTGFFNNPNYWAIFLLMNSFLCISGLVKYNSGFNVFLLLFSLTVSVVGLLFTGSRMGIVCFCVACLLVSNFRSKKFIFTLMLFILFLVFFALYNREFLLSLDFTVLEKSLSRFERIFSNVTEEDRFQRAELYLDSLFSNPQSYFFGLGLSALVGEGAPHNTLISLFRDFGLMLPILGISLFSLFVFTRLKNNTLCRHEVTLIKVTLISIPIILITNDIFDSRPFWIMLGLVVSFLSLKEKSDG